MHEQAIYAKCFFFFTFGNTFSKLKPCNGILIRWYIPHHLQTLFYQTLLLVFNHGRMIKSMNEINYFDASATTARYSAVESFERLEARVLPSIRGEPEHVSSP